MFSREKKGDGHMVNTIKQGDTVDYGIIEAVCDSAADLDNLPKDGSWYPGSTCLVIEDSSVWMLNSTNEWKKI